MNSSADKCRRNGWQVGDILEGDEGYGPDRIRITAIGERCVIARKVFPHEGYETLWNLDWRDWEKVGTTNDEPEPTEGE